MLIIILMVAKARKAFNSIIILISVTGIEASSPEEIVRLAVEHFLSILGPPTPQTTTLMIASVADMIRTARFSCSQAQAALLTRLPTPENITKTMFKLNKNKTLGPDGFTSGFYTAAWNLLGQEVINSITSYFKTFIMPSSTNATILTLLPKFPGATIIKDYWPISYCNTLYKVIFKILVNRLKPLLPTIILPNQTAFIKGRLLLENCLLASELVSGYHKQNCDTRHLQSGEQRATNNITYNKSPYTQLHSPKTQINIRIKSPVAPISPNIIYSSISP